MLAKRSALAMAAHELLYSTSDGNVYCCDSRNPGQVVFTLSAHDAGVSCMSMSHHVGCLKSWRCVLGETDCFYHRFPAFW